MPVPTPTMPGAGYEESLYRGPAMAQLRILKQQMALGGLKIGSRTVDLGNGVTCFCNICFNDEQVYINVPAGETVNKVIILDGPLSIVTADSSNSSMKREFLDNGVSSVWGNFTHIDGYINWCDSSLPPYGGGATGALQSFNPATDKQIANDNVPISRQNWQDGLGNVVEWQWRGDRYNRNGACGPTIWATGIGVVTAPGTVLGAGMRTVEGKKQLLVALSGKPIHSYDPLTKKWTALTGNNMETFPVYFTTSCHKAIYVWAPDGFDRTYRGAEMQGDFGYLGYIWSHVRNRWEYTTFTYTMAIEGSSYTTTELIEADADQFHTTRLVGFSANSNYTVDHSNDQYKSEIGNQGFSYFNMASSHELVNTVEMGSGCLASGIATTVCVDAQDDVIVLKYQSGELYQGWMIKYTLETGNIAVMKTAGYDDVFGVDMSYSQSTGSSLYIENSTWAFPLFSDMDSGNFSPGHADLYVSKEKSLPILIDLRAPEKVYCRYLENSYSFGMPGNPWTRRKMILDEKLWEIQGDYDPDYDIFVSKDVHPQSAIKFNNDPYATLIYVHNADPKLARVFVSVISAKNKIRTIYMDGEGTEIESIYGDKNLPETDDNIWLNKAHYYHGFGIVNSHVN